MLFPEKMLRVEISIDSGYENEVIEKIGNTGYLHIDSSKIFSGNESEKSQVKTLLALVQKYMKQLDIDTNREGIFSFSDIENLIDKTEEHLISIGKQTDDLMYEMKILTEERKIFEQAIAVKQVFKDVIDINILSKDLEYIHMRLGMVSMPSTELLRLALKQERLLVIDRLLFEKTSAVAIFCEEEDNRDVTKAFNTLKVTEIPLEYCRGEAYTSYKIREKKMLKEKQRMREEYSVQLQKMEDMLYTLNILEEVKSSLQNGDNGLLLKGWMPKNVSEDFLQKIDHATIVFLPSKGEAPVLLETSELFKPFEKLIRSFSYPSYGEVNPVIPFAFSFLLLFGIMFGDVGHGLLLALLGWMVKKYDAKYSDFGHIYYLSGLSSIAFGFLYGSVFGVHHLLPQLLFTPIENIQATIVLSIFIGIGIITLSFFLHIVTIFKRREFRLLFLSEGSLLWFLVYWFTIGIYVKSVVQHMDITYEFLILITLLLIILFTMLRKTAEKIQAVIDFFRTIMDAITNTLSFLRLGAFTLAHGALFMAVFSIAKMISEVYGEGFLYWMLIILGNVVIIVLEGVIVSIQTLRLEYYEFFKRFFKGGGIPYHPYRLGEKNEN